MHITVTKLSYVASIIGLIGKKKPYPLLFYTRFGIHTFFLVFPIDVVILDSKQCIVAVKESLVPNRIFFWDPRFNTVLELPSGTIRELHLHKGMQLQIKIAV